MFFSTILLRIIGLRYFDASGQMDWSPETIIKTGADAIEPAVQAVSDTLGQSSPANRDPDAPFAGFGPALLAVVVVLGLFAIWRVT
jgi:hypothetical protein